MKHHRIIKIGAVCAVVLLGAAAVYFASTAVLKNWRPLKEKGSAPKTANKTSSYASNGLSNFLICGIDNTNELTDVIMIAGYNSKTKKLNLLQIPRDTYVSGNIPSNKYNAVYGHHDENVSGMETLKARIESDFGITIDHYAAVTTKGLRNIVDAVGGVDVYVPINMNYDDDSQNLHIHLKKGYQHLDGKTAEEFVRYRKGWAQGDIGRLNAQRTFIAAFAEKIKSMGVVSLGTKAASVISPPNFLTDMSWYEMLNLYNSAKNVGLSDATLYTAPGEPFEKDGKDYYSVHKKALLEILNKGFVPEGTKLDLSDLKITEMANTEKSSGKSENFSQILSDEKNKK